MLGRGTILKQGWLYYVSYPVDVPGEDGLSARIQKRGSSEMKKLLYASKGWKRLQKEYIDQDCFALRSQKLAAVSQQDVTGFSYEEMVIHYGFIWNSALNCGIDQYVQTGSFTNMEVYFCLASKARQISSVFWERNPHKKIPTSVNFPIPWDILTAEILCGRTSSAEALLAESRAKLAYEQNRAIKKRRAIEIDLYEQLLREDTQQARQSLAELSKAQSSLSPELLVLNTFLAQDCVQFTEAITAHIRDYRLQAYPEAINYFVLFMEALFQKHGDFQPIDTADAPSAMLCLPPCDPTTMGEKLNITLPSFDLDWLMKAVDPVKVGPQFKQY